MYVCTSMCQCMHGCITHVCQPWALLLRSCPLCFWETLVGTEACLRLSCLSVWPWAPGISLSPDPVLGLQKDQHTSLFQVSSGNWKWILKVTQQGFYQLSCFHSPCHLFKSSFLYYSQEAKDTVTIKNTSFIYFSFLSSSNIWELKCI